MKPIEINAELIKSLGYGSIRNFEGTVARAAIDSRKIKNGMIFVALKGEQQDGHKFIQTAHKNGAGLCIVSEEWAQSNPTSTLPLWVVDSPEIAFQKLAAKWRSFFSIPFLAVTGTCGKTTTRSMIYEILRTKYSVHSTTGNLNNHLGLPLTLFDLNKDHNFSLLELGTNHFGEIKYLCEIAKPDTGLITNVGYGHTEFFGNPQGVARAKEELFQSLPENGTAFINLDDPYIPKMQIPENSVTYSFNRKNADYYGKIISISDDGAALFSINNNLKIQLRIPGIFSAENALAAAAVGKYYGLNDSDLRNALENFGGIDKRIRIVGGPCKIIDDTYNANPESTAAALETLSKMNVPGKRIFVFGDMLELGPEAKMLHSRIGKIAAEKTDILFTFGELAENTTKEARRIGMKQATHFSDKEELGRELVKILNPSDTILVKGSRGVRMEEVIQRITT